MKSRSDLLQMSANTISAIPVARGGVRKKSQSAFVQWAKSHPSATWEDVYDSAVSFFQQAKVAGGKVVENAWRDLMIEIAPSYETQVKHPTQWKKKMDGRLVTQNVDIWFSCVSRPRERKDGTFNDEYETLLPASRDKGRQMMLYAIIATDNPREVANLRTRSTKSRLVDLSNANDICNALCEIQSLL